MNIFDKRGKWRIFQGGFPKGRSKIEGEYKFYNISLIIANKQGNKDHFQSFLYTDISLIGLISIGLFSLTTPREAIFQFLSCKRPLIFVGDGEWATILEKPEKWEIDAFLSLVWRSEWDTGGEGVVVKEQSGRDVERDENIDRIMLVSGQDEEDAENVQNPT